MQPEATHSSQSSQKPVDIAENVLVRQAVWEDVRAILDIQNQGIEDRVATLDEELHTFAEQEEWYRNRPPSEPVLVAESGGQVVGWASLSRFSLRKAYNGVKELSVYVDRRWRGKGVGNALLEDLLQRAQSLPLYKIVLNTLSSNEGAIALYRKLGFRTVGVWRSQGRLAERWMDVMLMEKHLELPDPEMAATQDRSTHPVEGPDLGRAIVVKIGGSTLGSHDTTLQDVVTLQQRGFAPVVVHGGGKIISEWTQKQGVSPKFVRGLRVTDASSLDVVVAVLTGLINKSLVASLLSLGAKAVGISGVDGGMLEAKVQDPQLGLVGQVVRVDPQPIRQIVESGSIPVIAPVALNREANPDAGSILLNVNADIAAGEIAAALAAERLIFMTDVEGILDSSKRLISRLTENQARSLIQSGTVVGGMIPKVEACLIALARVPSVQIVDGRKPNTLLQCLESKALGTRVGKRA